MTRRVIDWDWYVNTLWKLLKSNVDYLRCIYGSKPNSTVIKVSAKWARRKLGKRGGNWMFHQALKVLESEGKLRILLKRKTNLSTTYLIELLA